MGAISDMDIERLKQAIEAGLDRGMRIVRGEVVANHLSGPKMPRGVGDEWNATLQPQTGYLRASIDTKTYWRSGAVYGSVFSQNVEYARKHEEGGYAIGTGGKRVRIPRRPFLRPSLLTRQKDVVNQVVRSIQDALRSGR